MPAVTLFQKPRFGAGIRQDVARHGMVPRKNAFARDAARQWRMNEILAAGIGGIKPEAISYAVSPFGGIRMSDLGREASWRAITNTMRLAA